MAIFRYPDAPHVRRHGPRGYANYESYKPWLRDEFAFCCVYCLCRERWFPDGEAAFGTDHLDPQSTSPDLRNAYENLVCACCQCNSIRGIAPIPSPFEEAYGRHLRV